MTKFYNISTDTSLGGNSPSDSTVCSQKAIKKYIDDGLDLKATSSSLADVAFTGQYNDLLYRPTIGNGTITITQGGVTKGSFSLNQSSSDTIALDAGGGNVAWGNISGTLANQTDLQNALNNKVSTGHQIIAFQEPTSTNDYTWYRKYADGWVEQGGKDTNQTITLPITMSDTNYCIQVTGMGGTSNNVCTVFGTIDVTTTGFKVQGNGVYNAGVSGANNTGTKRWYVCGMAAS